MTIINVERLTKNYGGFRAVDEISFSVESGELIGFLGVNGAGKTTTINMLSTLLVPDNGYAEICGAVLGRDNDTIRRRIGIVYQQNCLDSILTVKENLLCRGILHGASADDADRRLDELCTILDLGSFLKKPYKALSGGQKRRCEIAAALMHTPELLFLDEPTTGLDPATRADVWSVIDNLRRNMGMTVFLTTHYMEEAANANRIIIIDKGRILTEGTPFELREQYATDTVKLYCEQESIPLLRELLSAFGHNAAIEQYGVSFSVANTLDSLETVSKVREHITGFEVIQGKIDDVFLNVCGKQLATED